MFAGMSVQLTPNEIWTWALSNVGSAGVQAGKLQLATSFGQIVGTHLFSCKPSIFNRNFQPLLISEHKAKPAGRDMIKSDPVNIGVVVVKLRFNFA